MSKATSSRGPAALLAAGLSFAALHAAAADEAPFGRAVPLGARASIIVTVRDVSEFRSRYPSEFPAEDGALAAFQVEFGSSPPEVVYHFATDRRDPARSDIVLLCGEQRVNIAKLGSVPPGKSSHTFGRPGFYQAKDGRWVTLAGGGEPPLVLLFQLPDGCRPDTAPLLVDMGITIEGNEARYPLRFGQVPWKPPEL